MSKSIMMKKNTKLSQFVENPAIIANLINYLKSKGITQIRISCEIFPFLYSWFMRIPIPISTLQIPKIGNQSPLNMEYEPSMIECDRKMIKIIISRKQSTSIDYDFHRRHKERQLRHYKSYSQEQFEEQRNKDRQKRDEEMQIFIDNYTKNSSNRRVGEMERDNIGDKMCSRNYNEQRPTMAVLFCDNCEPIPKSNNCKPIPKSDNCELESDDYFVIRGNEKAYDNMKNNEDLWHKKHISSSLQNYSIDIDKLLTEKRNLKTEKDKMRNKILKILEEIKDVYIVSTSSNDKYAYIKSSYTNGQTLSSLLHLLQEKGLDAEIIKYNIRVSMTHMKISKGEKEGSQIQKCNVHFADDEEVEKSKQYTSTQRQGIIPAAIHTPPSGYIEHPPKSDDVVVNSLHLPSGHGRMNLDMYNHYRQYQSRGYRHNSECEEVANKNNNILKTETDKIQFYLSGNPSLTDTNISSPHESQNLQFSHQRTTSQQKPSIAQQLLLNMLKEQGLEAKSVGNTIEVSAYRPAIAPQPYTILKQPKEDLEKLNDGFITSERKSVYQPKHDTYVEASSKRNEDDLIPIQSSSILEQYKEKELKEDDIQNSNSSPFLIGAHCITDKGKQLLEDANNFLKDKYNAEVVYEDNDSSFINLNLNPDENQCISPIQVPAHNPILMGADFEDEDFENEDNKNSFILDEPRPKFRPLMLCNMIPSIEPHPSFSERRKILSYVSWSEKLHMEEKERKDALNKEIFSETNIQLIISQTNVDKERAIQALKIYDGDVVNAIEGITLAQKDEEKSKMRKSNNNVIITACEGDTKIIDKNDGSTVIHLGLNVASKLVDDLNTNSKQKIVSLKIEEVD